MTNILPIRDKVIDFFENTSFDKRKLYLFLIAAEMIAITILAWYLRAPLSQKYLTVSVKTFSAQGLNSDQRFLFAQGDFLTGQTEAANLIVTLLRDEASLNNRALWVRGNPKVDSQGNWFYQLPTTLTPGDYRLTVGVFTADKQAVTINHYRLKVLSNNIFLNPRPINDLVNTFSSKEPLPSSSSSAGSVTNAEEVSELLNSISERDTTISQPLFNFTIDTEEPVVEE